MGSTKPFLRTFVCVFCVCCVCVLCMCVCVLCMYDVCVCVFRDNLASDGFYGLVIVLLSLLGFISVVWLQDQIRNGGGPQWLEQDRMQMEQQQRREAERGGANNPGGQREPNENDGDERDAAALVESAERRQAVRLVEKLQEVRADYTRQLQEVQSGRFDRKLQDLRVRELELLYDLGVGQRHLMVVLRGARMKQGRRMKAWREEHRVRRYREEVGEEMAVPPEDYQAPDPIPSTLPPPDWGEEPLTAEEQTIMQVLLRV